MQNNNIGNLELSNNINSLNIEGTLPSFLRQNEICLYLLKKSTDIYQSILKYEYKDDLEKIYSEIVLSISNNEITVFNSINDSDDETKFDSFIELIICRYYNYSYHSDNEIRNILEDKDKVKKFYFDDFKGYIHEIEQNLEDVINTNFDKKNFGELNVNKILNFSLDLLSYQVYHSLHEDLRNSDIDIYVQLDQYDMENMKIFINESLD